MSNIAVRKSFVKEKKVKALIDLSKNDSLDYKRCAALVLSFITKEDHGRFELMENGHFSALMDLCHQSDLHIQIAATCAVANLAECCELHSYIVENGSITLFESLSLQCADTQLIREISRFVSAISNDDNARICIASNKSLVTSLIRFSRLNDVATQRYSTLAICNLSFDFVLKEKLLEHEGLLKNMLFLARYPDLEIQRVAVLAIASFAIGTSKKVKEKIASSGFLKPLLSIVKYPDEEVQKCSSLALNALILGNMDSIKSKLLELEKNSDVVLASLLELLKSTDKECMHNAIYALGSLVDFKDFRDNIVSLGCIEAVTEAVSKCNIEGKRASGYFFTLLAELSQYHDRLHRANAMEQIIHLANLVDIECQIYGAFAIAFIANHREYQVTIAKLGAVRPLVSMMTNSSETKHYASLALLRLAENFENHITIAEEGGIQALLKLGRDGATDEEVQYKAAVAVGALASNEVTKLTEEKKRQHNVEHWTESFRKNLPENY